MKTGNVLLIVFVLALLSSNSSGGAAKIFEAFNEKNR